MNNELSDNDSIRNGLLCNQENGPVASVAQIGSNRNYVNAELIEELAIKIYKTKSGNGTTYQDLMDAGLVLHKNQAQKKLKYHMTKGTLFTLKDTRPQQYYPSTIKSEIVKNVLQINEPIIPTGVALQNPHVSKKSLANCSCFFEDIIQTLERYVLPLLPKLHYSYITCTSKQKLVQNVM